jgi:hypothetical protein
VAIRPVVAIKMYEVRRRLFLDMIFGERKFWNTGLGSAYDRKGAAASDVTTLMPMALRRLSIPISIPIHFSSIQSLHPFSSLRRKCLSIIVYV